MSIFSAMNPLVRTRVSQMLKYFITTDIKCQALFILHFYHTIKFLQAALQNCEEEALQASGKIYKTNG